MNEDWRLTCTCSSTPSGHVSTHHPIVTEKRIRTSTYKLRRTRSSKVRDPVVTSAVSGNNNHSVATLVFRRRRAGCYFVSPSTLPYLCPFYPNQLNLTSISTKYADSRKCQRNPGHIWGDSQLGSSAKARRWASAQGTLPAPRPITPSLFDIASRFGM